MRVLFQEEQRFVPAWTWLFLVLWVVPVATLVFAIQTGGAAFLGPVLSFVIVALIELWLVSVRLVTVVDDHALRVSYKGVWPTRIVKLTDIKSYEVRTYGLADSGGWGVHLGLAGMTYNVSGNRGVSIRLKDGRGLLIGSQTPEALAGALATVVE